MNNNKKARTLKSPYLQTLEAEIKARSLRYTNPKKLASLPLDQFKQAYL